MRYQIAPAFRRANANPYAGKIIEPKLVYNAFHAVVAAGGAFFAYAKIAGVKVYIVIYNNKLIVLDLEPVDQIPYRPAGIVHEG